MQRDDQSLQHFVEELEGRLKAAGVTDDDYTAATRLNVNVKTVNQKSCPQPRKRLFLTGCEERK